MEPQDRIAELEYALKEKARRLQELKAELDKTSNLFKRMREHVQDCKEIIEAWKEGFGTVLEGDDLWHWSPFIAECEEWHNKYIALLRKWNRFVPEYNAVVRPRNVGRPLAASEEQQQTVIKLRAVGKSLRAIAEETSLGLTTVRTILDRRGRRDGTSVKHLERIRPDMDKERAWQSRRRTRDGLPRRISALQKQSAELEKEAKALK